MEEKNRSNIKLENKIQNDINAEADKFDAKILWLSAGALALTSSFQGSGNEIKSSPCVCLAIVSWIFFVLAILITIISLLYSMSYRQRCLEEVRINGTITSVRNKLLGHLNWVSGIVFCFGVILYLIFAAMSIAY